MGRKSLTPLVQHYSEVPQPVKKAKKKDIKKHVKLGIEEVKLSLFTDVIHVIRNLGNHKIKAIE